MLIVAHRGNKVSLPENTLGAFERAVQEGADLLETDIRVSADGVFICFHDSTLERTTEGRGYVTGKSLAELQEVKIRPVGGQGQGERVPRLEDLASILPPDVGAALELKDPRFAEPEICGRFAGELRRLGIFERTMVLSMSVKKIRAMRSAAPDLPVGFVSFAFVPPDSVDLLGPLWPLLVLNPFYVRWAHARGIIVCPLDPTPDARLALYRRKGCDAVLTDDPARTIRALRRIESVQTRS
jgi:glycerophosphoryl diester phosphodiesterase